MVPELPEKGASAEIVPVGKIEYFVTFPASAVAREGRRGVPRDAGKHANICFSHVCLMYASSMLRLPPPPASGKRCSGTLPWPCALILASLA